MAAAVSHSTVGRHVAVVKPSRIIYRGLAVQRNALSDQNGELGVGTLLQIQ